MEYIQSTMINIQYDLNIIVDDLYYNYELDYSTLN